MPLYIDLHVDNNLTPDLIKQCHVADKAIQDKYGVRYLQILLNQPQGHLFCLVEGPDKESCARVHQEAHGNIACNILEITQSDFSALLANKPKDGMDFTLNQDGSLDSGSRAILSLNLIGTPQNYQASNVIIKNILDRNEGRTGESFGNRLLAIFDTCTKAVDSGVQIRNEINEKGIPIEVRMGVSLGAPLEEKGNFFETAHKSADHLSFVASKGQITLTSKVKQLYRGDSKTIDDSIKVISLSDEKFLNQVMTCTDAMWNKNETTMEDFARELGMSKSQVTRKLNALSDLSPNEFFKEYRLRKAITLMEGQHMNIAEITMAIGFTNPSYFTKCFRTRFGKSPSEYMVNP